MALTSATVRNARLTAPRAGGAEGLGVAIPEHVVRDVALAEQTRRTAYTSLKRAMDAALCLLALLVLSPLLLLIAAAIRLEDGGPVFFSQVRLGKGGRPFRFWKFRSMHLDAEARREELKKQTGQLRFKMEDDPRITRAGRWIRRFSLDELPQLWNVLRGDMTLVGPRPPLPEEVAEYGPRDLRRLAVEQGITCTWQVAGRSLIPFEEQVAMDLDYIERRNLLLDVALLIRTVPAVLNGRGAC